MEIEKERVYQIFDEIIEEQEDGTFARIMASFSLYNLKNKDNEVMDQLKTKVNDWPILGWTMKQLIADVEKGILESTMQQLIAEIEKGINREIYQWTKSYNEKYPDACAEDVLYREWDEIDLIRTMLKISKEFNLDKFKKKMKHGDYPNMYEILIHKGFFPLLYTINAMAGILYRNEPMYIQHHEAIRKLEEDEWFMRFIDHFSFVSGDKKTKPNSFNNIIESFVNMFVLTYYYYYKYPVDY